MDLLDTPFPAYPLVDDTMLVLEAQEAYASLSPEHPYAIFSLPLREETYHLLQEMHLTRNGAYTNYGDIDQLHDGIVYYLVQQDPANKNHADEVATLVEHLVQDILIATEAETAMVELRGAVPPDYFTIPTWRIDDEFYAPDHTSHEKFILTLKGDGTLLYPADEATQARFASLYHDGANRGVLYKSLDQNAVKYTHAGEGCVLTLSTPTSPPYATPAITQERLTLTLIPGSASFIEDLFHHTYAIL